MIFEHEMGTPEEAAHEIVSFINEFRETFYSSHAPFNAHTLYKGMNAQLISNDQYDDWTLFCEPPNSTHRQFQFDVSFTKIRDIEVSYKSSSKNKISPTFATWTVNPLFFDFPCRFSATLYEECGVKKMGPASYITIDGSNNHKWFNDRDISRPTAEEWLMFAMETGIEI